MFYYFYAGCYTSDSAHSKESAHPKGIHLLRLDTDSGALSVEDSYYGGESPSFLIRAGDYLYAANETKNAGKVSAFSIGGTLTFLNSREVTGAGTCHVAVMNGFLCAANYESGGIFAVKILPDGSLGDVVTEIQHTGCGPNPNRQKTPHAHSVNPVPNANLLISADLGADKLFCYNQKEDGSLAPDSVSPAVAAPAGGGPRHIAFAPGGKRIFAAMEMGVTVVCYKLTETGLKQESVYPLVEGVVTEEVSAADIHFNRDGTRLYASVRGKNLISVFDSSNTASLKFTGSYPTFGDSPRNFCLSPNEEFIVIAHQISGHITVCPLDSRTGALGSALSSVVLPGASCVINY